MATTTVTTQTAASALPGTRLDVLEPKDERPVQPSATSLAHDPQDDAAPERGLDFKTVLKLVSASFAFFVAGVNDGSLGPIIPYLLGDYNISTGIVSSVYGASFVGWLLAALINTHLSERLDRGVMLALGAVLQVLAQVLRVWKPPFGLFVVTFFITTTGQGFQDSHANNFVADAKGAHRWLGFIHAMFMAGCLVGPFVSTAIASIDGGAVWSYFYGFPLGLGVLNLVLTLVAFWDSVRLIRPGEASRNGGEGSARTKGNAARLIKETFSMPSFWLLSLFFFFYLGASLTASGWVVEYLVSVRQGDVTKVGFVAAGYSGGGLLGRLVLVELIHRWGTKKMVALCCVLGIGLQLMFWLVPNIIAASVAVSLLGFFISPFFPVGVSVGSKLFHAEIRPTALAFLFVIAQIGGSLFPVLTGVLASHLGVGVLQPMLVGILAATLVSWLIVPRPKESGNVELHQE